jgi:hypothetical protein
MDVEKLAVHFWLGRQNDLEDTFHPDFYFKVGIRGTHVGFEPLKFVSIRFQVKLQQMNGYTNPR